MKKRRITGVGSNIALALPRSGGHTTRHMSQSDSTLRKTVYSKVSIRTVGDRYRAKISHGTASGDHTRLVRHHPDAQNARSNRYLHIENGKYKSAYRRVTTGALFRRRVGGMPTRPSRFLPQEGRQHALRSRTMAWESLSRPELVSRRSLPA